MAQCAYCSSGSGSCSGIGHAIMCSQVHGAVCAHCSSGGSSSSRQRCCSCSGHAVTCSHTHGAATAVAASLCACCAKGPSLVYECSCSVIGHAVTCSQLHGTVCAHTRMAQRQQWQRHCVLTAAKVPLLSNVVCLALCTGNSVLLLLLLLLVRKVPLCVRVQLVCTCAEFFPLSMLVFGCCGSG
jgi:hypothetical protein